MLKFQDESVPCGKKFLNMLKGSYFEISVAILLCGVSRHIHISTSNTVGIDRNKNLSPVIVRIWIVRSYYRPN